MSEILSFFNTRSEAVHNGLVFCELQKHFEQARSCAWGAVQPWLMLDWAYPCRRRETVKELS